MKKLFALRALASSLLVFGLGASLSASAVAANTYTNTQVSRWKEDARYFSGGNTVYAEEWGTLKGYDVRPNPAAKTLFPNAIVGDGNNKATSDNLWLSLANSNQVLGNSSNRLTRARDLSEDWDINFIVPGVNDKNYWFNWYADNMSAYVARSAFPLTLVNGPQAGASILNNQNLLAMGDDNSLWLNGDGSLSYYNYPTGTLEFTTTTKTFTSGPASWKGTTVSSQVGKLIGYEEGQLYFLEGANTLQIFNYNLGFVRTDQFAFDGDLAGKSLADVIDGKVANANYLGWDLGPIIAFTTTSTIPEPGTYALFGLGLVGLMWAGRRQA